MFYNRCIYIGITIAKNIVLCIYRILFSVIVPGAQNKIRTGIYLTHSLAFETIRIPFGGKSNVSQEAGHADNMGQLATATVNVWPVLRLRGRPYWQTHGRWVGVVTIALTMSSDEQNLWLAKRMNPCLSSIHALFLSLFSTFFSSASLHVLFLSCRVGVVVDSVSTQLSEVRDGHMQPGLWKHANTANSHYSSKF